MRESQPGLMNDLCDSGVFLALAVGQRTHHSLAANWFGGLSESDAAQFCRGTRICLLRLLPQKIAPDYQPLSNLEAWLALDRLMGDEATGFEKKPAGLELVWRDLS